MKLVFSGGERGVNNFVEILLICGAISYTVRLGLKNLLQHL